MSEPEPLTVDDLPAGLRERYVGRSGKWLLRVFAKDCLWDFEPLQHFTRQIATVDPEAKPVIAKRGKGIAPPNGQAFPRQKRK